MAAPNIGCPDNIDGQTAVLSASNSVADLIPAVASGHCFRVQAVYAANATTNGATPGWISLWHKKSSVSYPVCGLRTVVPANAGLNLLDGKILYIAEGDSITCQSDATDSVSLNAPYEDIS